MQKEGQSAAKSNDDNWPESPGILKGVAMGFLMNPVAVALVGVYKIGRSAIHEVAGLFQGSEAAAESRPVEAMEPVASSQEQEASPPAIPHEQVPAFEKPAIEGALADRAARIALNMDGVDHGVEDRSGAKSPSPTAGTAKDSGVRFP
jgi:hypothetical protein